MKILYSPQFNEKSKIEYTFFREIIKVEISTLVEKEEKSNFELDSVFYYDLSSVKEGIHSHGKHPVVSARRVAEELEIQLLMYIGDDASQDERFPELFIPEDIEFDIPEDAEIIQLEELVMPEPEPDPVGSLKAENHELRQSIKALRNSMVQNQQDTEELVITLLSMV